MKPLLLALLGFAVAAPLGAGGAASGARSPASAKGAPKDGAVFAKANVVYGRAGGAPLRLDLCVPAGRGPFAAVILVHGGGWIAGNKRGDTRPLLAPLTAGGFAWFSIDYRLAPQFRYPACLDDVCTAIRWVKAHAAEYNVDPNRIALIGESAGAHLVEMAAVLGPPDTRVAAVVPFFGPSDLLAQTMARGALRRDVRSLLGRTALDDTTKKLLRDASPLNYVHPGLPPFLLFHGTSDRIVPYAQSVAFAERLKEAGVTCRLVTIPGGNHAMGNWNRVAPGYKAELIGWLKTTLAPRTTVIASR